MVSSAVGEIKDINAEILLNNCINEGILKIESVDDEQYSKLDEVLLDSGDNMRLSQTDRDVVALSLKYKSLGHDVITVSEKAKQMPLVVLALESAERNFADYVSVDSANFTATFVRVPAFEDVPYPVQMFPELVVEFYSR